MRRCEAICLTAPPWGKVIHSSDLRKAGFGLRLSKREDILEPYQEFPQTAIWASRQWNCQRRRFWTQDPGPDRSRHGPLGNRTCLVAKACLPISVENRTTHYSSRIGNKNRPSTPESSLLYCTEPFDGEATSQAGSQTAPDLSERPQLAVRRANSLLGEQPKSTFRVPDPEVDRLRSTQRRNCEIIQHFP